MEQQTFVLTDYLDKQKRITPVTREILEEQLDKLNPGDQIRLEAPVIVEGKELFAVNCLRGERGYDLIFLLKKPEGGTKMAGYVVQNRTREKVLELLSAFVLEGNAPDFRESCWYPVEAMASTSDEAERMRAKERIEARFGHNKGGKK